MIQLVKGVLTTIGFVLYHHFSCIMQDWSIMQIPDRVLLNRCAWVSGGCFRYIGGCSHTFSINQVLHSTNTHNTTWSAVPTAADKKVTHPGLQSQYTQACSTSHRGDFKIHRALNPWASKTNDWGHRRKRTHHAEVFTTNGSQCRWPPREHKIHISTIQQ